MTYKDLFDAQHEYCTTEDYPNTAIRPHAFIAGAKWAIKRLSAIPTDKFDINALVPFEDKVLVRDDETDKWVPATWGFCDNSLEFSFTVEGGNGFKMCIPYKGNEHLLDTDNDCDDFYKTWED